MIAKIIQTLFPRQYDQFIKETAREEVLAHISPALIKRAEELCKPDNQGIQASQRDSDQC